MARHHPSLYWRVPCSSALQNVSASERSTQMSEGTRYPYTIVPRWSKQEQVYRAEVPAIPGCEGTGHTYEEALASV